MVLGPDEKSCLGPKGERAGVCKPGTKAKVKNGRSRVLLKNTQRVMGLLLGKKEVKERK